MKRLNFIKIIFFLSVLSLANLTVSSYADDNERKETLSQAEKAMLEEGNFSGTKEKLEKLLLEGEESVDIYVDLALAYYGLMEYQNAREYLEKGKELRANRRLKKMVEYFEENMRENKDLLQEIEDENKKLPGDFQNAAVIDELADRHFIMLSRLLDKKKYYAGVVLPHIIWLKNHTDKYNGLYALSAGVYYSSMMYKKAVEDYEKAVEKDADNAELYKMLADSRVALGDFDNAQKDYEKAIELYRETGTENGLIKSKKLEKVKKALPKTYGDISELIKNRQLEKAEEICRYRISLNPSDYAAIAQMGDIYWRYGERKKAIKFFRKAFKIAPDYPLAHLYLGKAYFFEHKPEKGIDEFKYFIKQMELLPDMDEATIDFYTGGLNYIAYMYTTLKEYDESIKMYRKVIKLDPDNQRAHFNLACTYYLYNNNRSRAYTEFQKVIEIDADSDIGKRAEYYIDFMRRNPDSRIIADISFIDEY